MASLIPKIKIGMPKKRATINLDFDNSTTANIGAIQPTMCREMVPNETFKVKVSSLVRLLAMNAPTFGRMSLRHYHCFVPYNKLWEPFDNMLSGQHYSKAGQNFIPTATPYFTMETVTKALIMNYSVISAAPANDLDHPITFNPSDGNSLTVCQSVWDTLRQGLAFGYADRPFSAGRGDMSDTGYGYLNLGAFGAFVTPDDSQLIFDVNVPQTSNVIPTNETVITVEGADLATQIGDYVYFFKFKPILKRVRTIFIGLGYQFNPYAHNVQFNPFKLLAYYMAWFELFRPNREMSWQDTNCYMLCEGMSIMNGVSIDSNFYWLQFLQDLATNCYYYLPMDYFSMATTAPQQANSDTPIEISSIVNGQAWSNGEGLDGGSQNATFNRYGRQEVHAGEGEIGFSGMNPIVMKMAFRLLTFANKNTVIGRSVRDWLRVHYGISDQSEISATGLYRIGSSRTNINISDVMSTADTAGSGGSDLGSFAGRGIGYGDSETFDFTAKDFGCWITLTVVVPESGYYQGYLRENRHFNRYDFFLPEFDALGYQTLERGELMDDYNSNSSEFNPLEGNDYSRTAAFGFVPRYSEYKVGRNIVNGDLSLIGMYNSMAPYTLDRRISGGMLGYAATDGNTWAALRKLVRPTFVPSIVYDNFRRIDPSDLLGQYNRIFTYGANDIDHFIIHNVFDVKAIAPMKSLTSSFDTYGNEDDSSIEVSHS